MANNRGEALSLFLRDLGAPAPVKASSVALECWHRMVAWAVTVHGLGGYDAACELATAGATPELRGHKPSWNSSALFYQAIGGRLGYTVEYYATVCYIIELWLDEGMSLHEIQSARAMMACVEAVQSAAEELREKGPQPGD